MDVELALAAVGTVATLWTAGLAWREFRGRDGGGTEGPQGSSVRPPLDRLPRTVRGRDPLLAELRAALRRPPGRTLVLAGPGGFGKSTVAAALAAEAGAVRHRGRARPVWWVPAGDPEALGAAQVTVARRAGAAPADLAALAQGAGDAPDRLWAALDRAPAGWLLVLDAADDPRTLTGPGWLRPSHRGLVVVTTRHTGAHAWGRDATLLPVGPLDEDAATLVLTDLAPAAGTPDTARHLARRLGGLPLALFLAGHHLHAGVARRPTFAGFRATLDTPPGGDWPGDPGPDADPRATITLTWELSLDALARRGTPQARTLLRLLSCYRPGDPVPRELLDPTVPALAAITAGATDPGADPGAGAGAEHAVDRGLRGLAEVGLLTVEPLPGGGGGLVVHRVIADVNRLHLGPARHPGSPVPAAAVELLVAALGRLRMDRPGDWRRYLRLAPHLDTLHRTTAGRLPPPLSAALAEATADAARAADRSGAHRLAAGLCRTALEHTAALGPDHPAVLALHHQRAWQIAFQGNTAEAETRYRRVYEARRRVLGDTDPETLAGRHELAWIAACQERWTEAEHAYREVLAARRAVLGATSPDTLTTAHELAWAVANQGRHTEAADALDRVHAARSATLGAHHPQTLASRHELAWVRGRAGRHHEAGALYREVLRARRRVLGESHPETLTTRHELAWTLAARGRSTEAERMCRAVLAERRRVLGERHPDTAASLRALTALRRGEPFEARHVV
ncbi:tetratricopeptide repeat protein [Streptomyces sp. NPDC000594]|uniref:tetratricopeptide repeat protein n=1 Tax=Streptomyces sp. NPDC000594 TaxID=3154261 RepID=UPI00331F9804